MLSKYQSAILITLLCFSIGFAAPPADREKPPLSAETDIADNTTYIDANTILMFVTNRGDFGNDVADVFGYDWGTFYPFVSTEYIEDGTLSDLSPIYASGVWIGGKVNNEIRVAVAEYSNEYWPGPMIDGSYDPDGNTNPYYRVYKLYKDSSTVNPNLDYLEYIDHAAAMGAPLDHNGRPLLLGDQTLWSVFNDANPTRHTNRAGTTDPLGIEVQMTSWASQNPGFNPVKGQSTVPYLTEIEVTHIGSSSLQVVVWVADHLKVTGDDYRVIFADEELNWHLENVTTNTRLLESQPINSVSEIVEGFVVGVYGAIPDGPLACFEVVANADGPLDQPEAGAAAWAGFPVPLDKYGYPAWPTENQQATGDGLWLFHVAEFGGTCVGGTATLYSDFLEQVFVYSQTQLGNYDYEMRFTGSNAEHGVGGSYAWANDDDAFWVPFELWRTGIGTPDDPSDDVRLVPEIRDLEYDDLYELESWGCINDPVYGGDGEHSVSGGDNDPFTNAVYWLLPTDDSPGQAGYEENEEQMLLGTFDWSLIEMQLMNRTVLVNWNGGDEPPFNQNCPEKGTVFRITTTKETGTPTDIFTFTASKPPSVKAGAEGQTIYLSYKLFNKSNETITDCYFSLWSDPDLGHAGDDLVACDTLDNLFFTYNGVNLDRKYGYMVPAVGFKYIYGPMVPSIGDSAYFEHKWIQDYRNLGMTAFTKHINGTDPEHFTETYGFMQGLNKSGYPYVYDGQELTYWHSGDPVAGTGDLDIAADDRRMIASCGPFDFHPGDSQYVLIKMAAARGTDRINSITRLREILNTPFELKLPGPTSKTAAVPEKFAVEQNYPNPFNPSTTIMYSLPERARVTVDVFNVLGQRVRRLVDKTQPAGDHSVVWNGDDESGEQVSTGLYFYRVKAGDKIEHKKMLLLK